MEALGGAIARLWRRRRMRREEEEESRKGKRVKGEEKDERETLEVGGRCRGPKRTSGDTIAKRRCERERQEEKGHTGAGGGERSFQTEAK